MKHSNFPISYITDVQTIFHLLFSNLKASSVYPTITTGIFLACPEMPDHALFLWMSNHIAQLVCEIL